MASLTSYDWTKPLFITATTLSAFACGGIASITMITMPALLRHLPKTTSGAPYTEKPTLPSHPTSAAQVSLILTQWRQVYGLGHIIFPCTAVLASICHLANAYIHYAPVDSAAGNALGGAYGTRRSYYFVAAAVLIMGIAPYTEIVMRSVNVELHRREEDGRGVVGDWTAQFEKSGRKRVRGETEDLMRDWSVKNLQRGLWPLAGAIVGFQAL